MENIDHHIIWNTAKREITVFDTKVAKVGSDSRYFRFLSKQPFPLARVPAQKESPADCSGALIDDFQHEIWILDID